MKDKIIYILLLILTIGCHQISKEEIQQVSQALESGGTGGSGGGGIENELPQCDEVMPSIIEAPPPGWVTVPESTTQTLMPGERVSVLGDRQEYVGQICHTQLLVSQTNYKEYWIMCGLFATVAVELPQQWVIVDFGGHNSGLPPFVNGQPSPGGLEFQLLMGTLADLSPGKPIGTVVPSHPHQDHTGNLRLIQQLNPSVRVVVSKYYLEHVNANNLDLVKPFQPIAGHSLVTKRDGSFNVDSFKFGLKTPVTVAHTPADHVIITPGKTCHVVDILHFDRLSFVDLSVVQSVDGMVLMLNYLAGLAEEGKCERMSIGHMNLSIGSQQVLQDVEFARGYLLSLYGAFWMAMQQIQQEGLTSADYFPEDFENHPHNFHAHVGISRLFADIRVRMENILYPQWKHFIGASVMGEHIQQVVQQTFLLRLNSDPFTSDPNKIFPLAINSSEIKFSD